VPNSAGIVFEVQRDHRLPHPPTGTVMVVRGASDVKNTYQILKASLARISVSQKARKICTFVNFDLFIRDVLLLPRIWPQKLSFSLDHFLGMRSFKK
jgi:hypothetical protein